MIPEETPTGKLASTIPEVTTTGRWKIMAPLLKGGHL